jgi:uncharacterized protein YcnI
MTPTTEVYRMRSSRLSTLLVLAAVVLVASAHVTVQPKQVTAKGYSELTIQVPTEKPEPTVKLHVEFPKELKVSRLRAKQGWTADVERDSSKAITAVTWSGGKIGPNEYDQFAVQARIPAEPAVVAIRAFQTYEGGEVVAWADTVDPKAKHPAPKLSIVAGPSTFASTVQGNWLGGTAMLLGLVAVTMSMRNGKNGKHQA